ncbi:MBL fold metallo-hydrolase [Polycladomyces abyssicola]|uniref:MBL fold metallo-hydrolase n=1 Tax=Polycladomyces abyssicola TaxID=1125966 RepID=A0A8D5ZKN0_9BACL|nr:MBL fold metallo-hydrolase [Polycladomyces abyssicola]BCU81644.1 MBL fold metallo-hydrolase [Polycladomyces abyssicola]
MKIKLIRHATFQIRYAGVELLVDPMLSKAGSLPPTTNTPNQRSNPLVSLLHPDVILLTHLHRDHFDDEAVNRLPKHIPILCQPPDQESLHKKGFMDVRPINKQVSYKGIRFSRTGGQHATGEIGQKMGPVSGFVLQAQGEPSLYLTGDTIWCPEVETALMTYRPEVVVVFAGAAQFLTGDPITMAKEDVRKLRQAVPNSEITVAHMEVWNHCLLTREELKRDLADQGLIEGVWVPEDGEEREFFR